MIKLNSFLFFIYFIGDGCIFIWRLPQTMTSNMLARLKLRSSSSNNNNVAIIQQTNQMNDSDKQMITDNLPASDIAVGQPGSNILDPNANQLPVWAKKQINANALDSPQEEFANPHLESNETNSNEQINHSTSKTNTPKGRWGQRLASENANETDLKSENKNIVDTDITTQNQQNTNSNKQVQQLSYLKLISAWFSH